MLVFVVGACVICVRFCLFFGVVVRVWRRIVGMMCIRCPFSFCGYKLVSEVVF